MLGKGGFGDVYKAMLRGKVSELLGCVVCSEWVCGVWCVVRGVWCVVSGCVVCGEWVCGVWCVKSR